MGIFGVLGKMAGSKVIEKVEDELTKKQKHSSFIWNAYGFCMLC